MSRIPLRITALALVGLVLASVAPAQGGLPLVIIVGVNAGAVGARRDEVLRRTLAQAGHVEGQTVRVVSVSVENDVERLPDLARAAVAADPCARRHRGRLRSQELLDGALVPIQAHACNVRYAQLTPGKLIR